MEMEFLLLFFGLHSYFLINFVSSVHLETRPNQMQSRNLDNSHLKQIFPICALMFRLRFSLPLTFSEMQSLYFLFFHSIYITSNFIRIKLFRAINKFFSLRWKLLVSFFRRFQMCDVINEQTS